MALTPRIKTGLWLAFTLLTVAVFFTGLSAHAGPSKGDPALGKKVFTAKGCFACHQVDGKGGVKLTGNPTPNWRDAKRMSDPKYDDDYLRDCITNGKIKSGMVAWSKQGVKPEQIEDLIAYIRTFSGTKSASARASATPKVEATARFKTSREAEVAPKVETTSEAATSTEASSPAARTPRKVLMVMMELEPAEIESLMTYITTLMGTKDTPAKVDTVVKAGTNAKPDSSKKAEPGKK